MPAINETEFAARAKIQGEWTVCCHERVTMTSEHEAGILRLHVGNATGANWHAELQCAPLRVRAGDVFDLSFSARADHPFTFSVWLGQQDAPYESLVSEANHFGNQTMTSEWQAFSHRWVADRMEEEARLNFVFGQVDNTIEIKDVRLQQQAA